MRSGSRGCPVAQQGGSCHPCAVLWHTRRPCIPSWHPRRRAAAKACEGDKIRVLFVTLEPLHATFRLPRIPSRHPRRRAATRQSEGDGIGAFFVALAPFRGKIRLPRVLSRQRPSARPRHRREMQNRKRSRQLACGLAIIPTCVPLAQLDRASASGAEGRGFESHRGHHFSTTQSTKRAIF